MSKKAEKKVDPKTYQWSEQDYIAAGKVTIKVRVDREIAIKFYRYMKRHSLKTNVEGFTSIVQTLK